MRTVTTIALGALAVYLLLLGGLFGCQRQMMYMPIGNLPAPADVGLPRANLLTARTSDGLELISWHVPALDDERPTIVLFQGNAGNISHRAFIAKALAEAGYGVVLAGYRGYGGNPGSPGEPGLLADGRALLDVLAERGVSAESTALMGESLGSGVAVRLASERPVAAVILISPFTSAVDVAARHYPIFPVRLLMTDRFDNLGPIREIDAPLLVVHGDADTIVPTELGWRLFDAASDPKSLEIIPGAGHNDIYQYGALERVLAFLRRLQD
ncbi:alpha/beta hydrolase [Fodinicurvata sp. EGI_FJ10296]|uniref:alpha/beta hydrolase n=1 Tax=Fodinicurvata sp. EGI_FJ10296 TaxID=3231908 RepID=UPI003453A921